MKHRLQCIPIHKNETTTFENIIKHHFISLNVDKFYNE